MAEQNRVERVAVPGATEVLRVRLTPTAGGWPNNPVLPLLVYKVRVELQRGNVTEVDHDRRIVVVGDTSVTSPRLHEQCSQTIVHQPARLTSMEVVAFIFVLRAQTLGTMTTLTCVTKHTYPCRTRAYACMPLSSWLGKGCLEGRERHGQARHFTQKKWLGEAMVRYRLSIPPLPRHGGELHVFVVRPHGSPITVQITHPRRDTVGRPPS
jgi:hypothetical protein